MTALTGRYPYEAAVTAYGNGGFRFADMSHKGSILCLPSGVHAWAPQRVDELTIGNFAQVFSDLEPPAVLLIGTGATHIFMGAEITSAFAEAGIGLEAMTTGAAARTYNIMLAERRRIGAALIVVT